MKKKILLIPLAMFMATGVIGLASCEPVHHDDPVNPETLKLLSIAVKTKPTKLTYNAGEMFDSTGMAIQATYSDGSQKEVLGWTVDKTVLAAGDTAVTVSYTEGDVTKTAIVAITVSADPSVKSLSSIAVTQQPSKVDYIAGETFDAAGLEVIASYSDGSSAVVSQGLSFDKTEPLSVSDTKVVVSYTEGGVTVSADIAITVADPTVVSLVRIEVTTPPTKVNYTVGDTFSDAGLVVTAVYSDSSSHTVQASCSSPDMSSAGTKTVIVSYTEDGVTKTTTFTITVVQGEATTITPEQAISLMDQAGEGVVVSGLKQVKGICASGTQYDSQYAQYTTGFNGVANFKVQFTDKNNILNGASPDGMEIVVEGYLEKYQGKYQLAYLKADISPTGQKFTPNLISAEIPEHEGTLTSITVSEAHRQFKVGASFVAETVTAHYSDGSTANVTAAATFAGYNMNSTGNQTVTVSYTEDTITKTTTYDIKVVNELTPEHAGTQADPYTGADAVLIASELEKGQATDELYYIKGVVQSFKESFSTEHGNYSFEIENGFIGWRLLNGSGKAKFNEGDLEVGDTVTMYAKIQKYTDGKPETKDGYITNIEKGGTPSPGEPAINLDKYSATINVGGDVTVTATPVNSEESVSWAINSGNTFVSITPSGNSVTIHGIAAGAAIVRATLGTTGKYKDCNVTVKGEGPEIEGVVLDFEDLTEPSGTSSGITYASAKNTGQSEPAYNANRKELRLYAKNTLTISASNITKITFDYNDCYAPDPDTCKKALADFASASVGTYANGTWTGSATDSVTFTVEDTNQMHIHKIGVVCSTPTPPDPVAVTGISFNPTETTISVGGTTTLNPIIAPSNATNKNVSYQVTSGSDKISLSGTTVTGLLEGDGVVTAKTEDGNFTATFTVHVNGTTPTPPVGNTVTLNMGDVFSANKFETQKQYTDWTYSGITAHIDAEKSSSTATEINSGKFYENSGVYTMRIYQNEKVQLTLSASSTIESVVINYDSNNGGVISVGSATYASGATISNDSTSFSCGVANLGSATNGQARIKSIVVTLSGGVVPPTPGKQIESLGKVTAPESINKNGTLDTKDVTVEVVYDDKTKGTVNPDSIDLVTSTVSDSVTGTVHVGDLTATFTIKVVEAPTTKDYEFAYESKTNPTGLTSSVAAGGFETGGRLAQWTSCGGFTISTSNSYSNVTKVIVNTSTNGADNVYKISCTVGGNEFGSTVSMLKKSANEDIVFEDDAAEGVVVITYTFTSGTKKSIYVGKVTITAK